MYTHVLQYTPSYLIAGDEATKVANAGWDLQTRENYDNGTFNSGEFDHLYPRGAGARIATIKHLKMCVGVELGITPDRIFLRPGTVSIGYIPNSGAELPEDMDPHDPKVIYQDEPVFYVYIQ